MRNSNQVDYPAKMQRNHIVGRIGSTILPCMPADSSINEHVAEVTRLLMKRKSQ
jgi:hypothetical protein